MNVNPVSFVSFRGNYFQMYKTEKDLFSGKWVVYPSEEDLLLKSAEYKKLLNLQDKRESTPKERFVSPYIGLAEFNELAQSKYFNTPSEFKKLTTIISTLEQKRQNALRTVSSPFYRSATTPDSLRIDASVDVSECVKNINKFFKSTFSDDLKYYIKDNSEILTNLYLTSVNLGYLDEKNPDVYMLNNLSFPKR